jgi:hypothetical protein
MSTIISNSVQNFSVTQKEFEQTNIERQRVKAEKSQDYDSGTAKNTEDTVKIESSSRRSIEGYQGRSEIKDEEQAQKLVEETVGLINSESNKLQMDQVHILDSGSIVDLLA